MNCITSGTSDQHAAPEGDRSADAQPSLHLRLRQRRDALGLFDVVRDHLALLGIQQPDLSRRDAVGRLVQQTRTQLLLHRGHHLGRRRLTHVELVSGLAEGTQVHDADEQTHGLHAIYGSRVGHALSASQHSRLE